ncbi:MAG: polysaccharide biosynthesis/export family protein [Chthoniobacteraceae bacterium]
MRSCLFLGVLAVLLTSFATVSTAQSDMLGTARPVRGANRPAAPPEAYPASAPVSSSSGGITVSRDTKLTAGDEVTIKIVEDRDPMPLKTVVSDTGEVELNGLGRVPVSGKSSTEAESAISKYLTQKYYHRATVEVGVVRKAMGTVRRFKVSITGKVGRPGPQFFDEANPLTLTEAVTMSMTNSYSRTEKVRLTRGGRTTEHDVKAITKEGRTDLDVRLQDGDQIYVPTVVIRFGSE